VGLYGRLISEKASGKHFEKTRPLPFEKVARDYQPGLTNKPRRKNENQARLRFWIERFGFQDIRTINAQDIETALHDPKTTRKLETARRYFTTLRAILRKQKKAFTSGLPTEDIKFPKPDNMLVRCLTDAQEASLFSVLPERYHGIVRFSLQTALRQGETLKLLWADIQRKDRVATIRQPKGGVSRTVPLNSTALDILKREYDACLPLPGSKVFACDARYLRRAFDRAVTVAGLQPFPSLA